MTKISQEAIKKIAFLARLEIEETQMPAIADNFSKIVDFIEQMANIDVSTIEPLSHALDMQQPTRPDVVSEHNQRELFLSLAPQTAEGLYLVPQVIE